MKNKQPPLGLMAVEGLEVLPLITLHEEPINAGECPNDSIGAGDVSLAALGSDSANVDQLIGVAQALDGISQHLVQANDSEGVSAHTAAALSAAVEHLCASAGLFKRPAFCLENYGGRIARKQATSVALESITGAIKAVVAKILKWIGVAMSYIYDSVQELMQGADNMAERAREVQEKAKTISHKTVKEGSDEITEPELVRFFTNKDKVIGTSEVASTYEAYTKLMGKNFFVFLKEMSSQISTAVTEAKEGDSKEETLAKAHKTVSELKSRAFAGFEQKTDSPTHELLGFDLPFGQRSMLVSLTKEEGKYSGLGVVLEKTKNTSALSSKGKLSALSYAQIVEVAKAIEKEMLFGLYKDYTVTKSALAKIEREVVRGCESITNAQQSGTASDNATITYSVHFLKDLVSSVIQMTAEIHRYDIVLAKWLLTYCTKSIKMHS